MRKALVFGLIAAVSGGLSIAACNTASPTDDGDDGKLPSGVTFHKDVEPILHKSCLTCHSEGQIGGFSLANYADAKKLANLMVTKTAAGEMPPFSAQDTAECKPRFGWRDDPRLTADELATLKAWADNDAPEGDPADAPPPFELKPIGLSATDMEITAPQATTVDGTKDQFMCVVYDPKLTETKYIDGIHFVAGNAGVAHHALLFQVKREDLAAQGGANQFECFGTPSDNPTLLSAWAPGSVPVELPPDVGMEIGADDVIVIQMHYHPRDKSESDQSKIQVSFTQSKPKWGYVTALIGNASSEGDGLLAGPNDAGGVPEFRIPANVAGHTEDMKFTLGIDTPGPYPVLAVGTHMHYVGTDMRVTLQRANGNVSDLQPKDECLVETPHWDFNWQRWYQYDTDIASLPTLGLGDTLHMHCEYDNTKENPFVYTALDQQGLSEPTDVRLGEMTLDEMCLGVVGVLVPM